MPLRNLFLTFAGLSLVACGGRGDKTEDDPGEPRALSPIGVAGTQGLRLFNALSGKTVRLAVGAASTPTVTYGDVSPGGVALEASAARLNVTDVLNGGSLIDQILNSADEGKSYTIYAYGATQNRIAISENGPVGISGYSAFRVVWLLEDSAKLRGVLRYGAASTSFLGGTLTEDPIAYLLFENTQPFAVTFTLENSETFETLSVTQPVSFQLAEADPRTLVIYGTPARPRFALLRD